MTDEEKKAIETLKEVASDDFDTLGDDISPKMAQNILNFIKKLQKEIKEGYHKGFTDGRISMKYEVQDKIREKIKSFQDVKKEIIKNENKLLRSSITYDIVRNDYCEKMIQELLEEN